ncbi:MAG: hypothetical protein R3F65_13915 [bacterium]
MSRSASKPCIFNITASRIAGFFAASASMVSLLRAKRLCCASTVVLHPDTSATHNSARHPSTPTLHFD